MLESVLVIFTGFLVFYTFNLGRIEVFDKRYKVYESVCELIRSINKYNDNTLDEIIRQLKEISRMAPENPLRWGKETFRLNYEKSHDQFIFHIESSRFLYNNEIYEFLIRMKSKADIIKNYLETVFLSLEKPENKEEYEEAINYFSIDVFQVLLEKSCITKNEGNSILLSQRKELYESLLAGIIDKEKIEKALKEINPEATSGA